MVKVEVSHNVKTWEHFEELGVQYAYPKFNVDLTISDDEYKLLLCLKVTIEAHYYVSGSTNFEIDKIKYKDLLYGISIEEAADLLSKNRDKIEETLKKSLKDTLIDSDDIMNIVDNY